jgi:hypothetical protein
MANLDGADPRFQASSGLILATSKLVELLKSKGVVSEFEIDAVLESAENGPLVSFEESEKAAPYRQNALFPIRMLRVLNRTWPAGTMPSPQAIDDFLGCRTHEL